MLQLEQPCCLIPGHSSAATGHLESMSTTVLLSVPQISLLSMRLMLCRERGCLGQLRAGEKADSRRKGEGGVCVFFIVGSGGGSSTTRYLHGVSAPCMQGATWLGH